MATQSMPPATASRRRLPAGSRVRRAPPRPARPSAYVRYLEERLATLAAALDAAQAGDLAVRLPADDAPGSPEAAFNALVHRGDVFTREIVRVGHAMGRAGQTGAHVEVGDVAGDWRASSDSLNGLLDGFSWHTQEVARLVNDVADGDLSRKMLLEFEGRPIQGDSLRAGVAVNRLVDRLRDLSSEVSRVAREVGTEGKLGGQADLRDAAGSWKDLTNDVNLLAGNLTTQVRNIALVTTAVANGDLSQKITVEVRGEVLALKNTVNTMVDQLRAFAAEVTRVAREVGVEGRLGGQAQVPGVAGTWKGLTDNVNMLAGNLTGQVRNIAVVTTAVANGDLSQKITVDARGEVLALKNTVNAMVDGLRAFAREVTRVGREVGTEGKLGGQARVPGLAGTWRDLTENVNQMASNLTNQVRGIAAVVTAVAEGDLSQKLVVDAKGEVAALADTINNMTGTLRTFAQQVSSVAREVGIEGQLGGQAKVPGAAGTWRDLTDNVNQLAGNLTGQVRAISEVATAVTKGDLTGTIAVAARGEVLALKDTINQMIANLRDTTRANNEQDWLKSNLAKFTQMMQGQRSLARLAELVISELTPLVSAQQGAFFVAFPTQAGSAPELRLLSSYAFARRRGIATHYALGEGLVGQCALEKKTILVDDVPPDYIRIGSSLGEATPTQILVLPVLFEGHIRGVIELASFRPFSRIHITFLEQLSMSIGVVCNMIAASARTEELLQELKGSNVELEERTAELEQQASLLQDKNHEIAEASASLEEKARQLARVSQYKSAFLANMSHELRTPLNSLLILARLLAENAEGNLDSRQVEYARTIFAAGNDLLGLISQILDLSKIEAGKTDVVRDRVDLTELREALTRSFAAQARQRNLAFNVTCAADAPRALVTDPQRLQQILANLLANAFKFTERGEVRLRIGVDARRPRPYRSSRLRDATSVVTFEVADTGIGIPPEKQEIIFDAFQQADASTSRNYGGTGLGLTISRELARLLGGEITLESAPQRGSRFILALPGDAAGATDADSDATLLAVPAGSRGHVPEAARPLAGGGVAAGDAATAASEAAWIAGASADTHTPEPRVGADAARPVTTWATEAAERASRRAARLGGAATPTTAAGAMPAAAAPSSVPVDPPGAAATAIPSAVRAGTVDVASLPAAARPVQSGKLSTPQWNAVQGTLPKVGEQGSLPSVAGRRVLLIDDDVRNLFAVTSLLEQRGVEVHPAGSGSEGLDILASRSDIDVVLLDIMMPEMDGYEVARRVRGQPRYANLPMIALTAKAMPGDREKCLEAGCSHFLPKPVEVDLLLESIGAAMPVAGGP